MKTKLTFAVLAIAGLGACATTVITPMIRVDPLADNAMAVARQTLTGTTLPNGVTITPAVSLALSECIAEHATFEELTVISTSADQATVGAAIGAVLARPATVTCATSALT